MVWKLFGLFFSSSPLTFWQNLKGTTASLVLPGRFSAGLCLEESAVRRPAQEPVLRIWLAWKLPADHRELHRTWCERPPYFKAVGEEVERDNLGCPDMTGSSVLVPARHLISKSWLYVRLFNGSEQSCAENPTAWSGTSRTLHTMEPLPPCSLTSPRSCCCNRCCAVGNDSCMKPLEEVGA